MREIAYRKNMNMKIFAKWMAIVVENVALIILSISSEFFFTRNSIFKTE